MEVAWLWCPAHGINSSSVSEFAEFWGKMRTGPAFPEYVYDMFLDSKKNKSLPYGEATYPYAKDRKPSMAKHHISSTINPS